MGKIAAYEATDGTLFKDKAAYRAYQHSLNISDGVEKIAARAFHHDGTNDVGSPFMLARFLVANGEDLKAALAGRSLVGPEQPELELVTESAPV